MQIQVVGKQLDVGEALSEHIESGFASAISKYFDRPVDAHVTVSKDRHQFRCDAHVHLATGLTAQSSATASDVYAAVDQAGERIEKQLRRYKRRLKDHHSKRRGPVEAFEAQAYVLEGGDSGDAEEPETLQPIIVAETTHPIQSLSVGEAVMQMELADKSFLMFRHDGNGRVNLVYRREDGNVGWIDPADKSQT